MIAVSDLSEKEERGFEERLALAEKQLLSSKKSRKACSGEGRSSSGFEMAFRVGSDMIAGVVVGAAIGYGLDYWTNHRVMFLILFSFLGFGAGMRNVWRVVNAPVVQAGEKKEEGSEQHGRRIKD